ncbi:unnamed protein product [Discula destructiva]
MRLSRRARRLAFSPVLLLSAPWHTLANPKDLIAVPQHEGRGLSDLLSGSALGNLTDDIHGLIDDAASLLTSFVAAVQEFNNATNENDLVELLGVDLQGDTNDDDTSVTTSTIGAVGANATCPGMAVLFARGTGEPGNVGLFTGPSFFTALRNYVNGSTTLAIQGIPYPASIAGFLVGGSPFGSSLMALMINKTAAACPNTKLVLSGYSQGAQVVQNAMQLINANDNSSSSSSSSNTLVSANGSFALASAVNERVMSVVLFGDPRNGTAVEGVAAARVLSLCHAQDDICARGGDIITLDHLTYNQNAAQAAMFVMQKSGLRLASADAMEQGMGNVPTVKGTGNVKGATQIGSGAVFPGFVGILSGGGKV